MLDVKAVQFRLLSPSRCAATQDDNSESLNYFDIRPLLCSNTSSGSVKSYVHKHYPGMPPIWFHTHGPCIPHGDGCRPLSNHQQLDRSIQWQMGESKTLG